MVGRALAAEAAALCAPRLYIEDFTIGRLQLWLDMHISQRAPLLPVAIDASRCETPSDQLSAPSSCMSNVTCMCQSMYFVARNQLDGGCTSLIMLVAVQSSCGGSFATSARSAVRTSSGGQGLAGPLRC